MVERCEPGRKVTCFGCQSRASSEWGALDGDDLACLNQVKICNVYQPGQTIFYQGNPCLGLYCVESGTVAIRKTDADGNSVIVRLACNGETLGYRAYFAGEPYRASADALQPSRVCFVDRNAVQLLLDRNPALGYGFLRHMAKDLEEAEQARLHAAALPVRARIAHLLLALRDRFSMPGQANGALALDLPLSRQDIAAMVGTRPETVARVVRALESDGVALFRGRRVEVPSLARLVEELQAEDV
ncbi:MAG: Crp/Fnr family transcriptional regulator [Deltaproteobacteria bacterium]|nr:Crp/Fnr family transcriptional regulator [Deltaproteobacteria bacterium]